VEDGGERVELLAQLRGGETADLDLPGHGSSESRTSGVVEPLCMRVIAGTHRGARIAAPKGLATRPTGDRVREAAFNLIGPVDEARVLDLFAGSGAMGIEALSRGAASVTFVESDRAACRTISENLERLRLTGARVTCADAVWELRRESRTYDLVLVDPPYEAWAELEPKLAEHLPKVLAPDGLLVVETGARTEPALPLPLRTSRRYGSARLTLFEPTP
jgi:16S rRNA (guanine966-N2)-methyltransferase